MRMRAFALRNLKEMLRDPINLAFGLGFPIVLLLLLSAIQANVPVELFEIQKLTPGIAVFGFSFISLFSATIISKDRTTSFISRLYSSPMTAIDFIVGYTLPMLPVAVMQSLVCFLLAIVLGLQITVNILISVVVLLPAAVLFIGIGLLCGTVFNDKAVGGICGALLTNLTAWLSGVWFDLNLVGGVFVTVAKALPFVHAVDAARFALNGEFGSILPELWWVVGYAVVVFAAAVLLFKRKMAKM